MLEWLLGNKSVESKEPTREVLLAAVQSHNPYAVDVRKWCVYKGIVGIAHRIEGTEVELHVVGDTGETTDVVVVPYMDLRLATYQQIPEKRRSGLSPALAALRGYI